MLHSTILLVPDFAIVNALNPPIPVLCTTIPTGHSRVPVI